jgi:WD40 repeat protein
MFSRQGLSIAALTLLGLVVTRSAAAQSISHLLESKDHYTGPVAKKVAEFNETFVVGGVDFSADGTQLATNGMLAEPEVHIRDWRDHGHIVRVLHMNSIAGDGSAIRYSPDGSLLAVGHARDTQQNGFGLIRIWNSKTGEVVHDIAEPQGATEFMSFGFLPNNEFLIRTVNRGGNPGDYVVVNRTDTWEQMWGLDTLPFIPRTLTLSPDGQLAAIGGEALDLGSRAPAIIHHTQILIVDLNKRQIVRTIERAFPDDNEIHTLSWSPDSRYLAAGAIVGGSFAGPDAVKIFDPATGTQRMGEPGESAYVSGLSYSPDGRFLIEGYIDGKVRVWDGNHKQLLQSIPVDDHFHTVLRVSRDSRYVAIADGKRVAIWELN